MKGRMIKTCTKCGKDFYARKGYFHICRDCWSEKIGKTTNWCAAIKDNGEPCKNHAQNGEKFCHSHLKAGYSLFTRPASQSRTPSPYIIRKNTPGKMG